MTADASVFPIMFFENCNLPSPYHCSTCARIRGHLSNSWAFVKKYKRIKVNLCIMVHSGKLINWHHCYLSASGSRDRRLTHFCARVSHTSHTSVLLMCIMCHPSPVHVDSLRNKHKAIGHWATAAAAHIPHLLLCPCCASVMFRVALSRDVAGSNGCFTHHSIGPTNSTIIVRKKTKSAPARQWRAGGGLPLNKICSPSQRAGPS